MKKKVSVIFLAVISLFFHKVDVQASNVDNFGIGSEAGSLGGAFTANANDPFAVFYNPAGLGQGKTRQFSAGAIVLNPYLKAGDFTVADHGLYSKKTEDISDNCVSPHIGYSAAVTSKFAVGIAAYSPYGLMVEWNDDPAKNPAAYNCYESWYVREAVTPGFSYRVTDNLSLGASVSLGSSRAGRNFVSERLSYALKKNVKIKTDLKDDFNYSYNLGVLYKPSEKLSLGLTYRGRTHTNFKGDLKVSSDADLSFLPKQKYKAQLKSVDHPEQVQAGIRYCFTEKFSVEVDALWIRWSIVEDENVFFKDADAFLKGALGGNNYQHFDRNWDDTTQIKIGMEYKLNDIVSLRCGYFNDPSPIPDDSFDLEWPCCDKETYTFGLGLDYTSWAFDAMISYSETDKRIIDKGESDNLNDSYKSQVYTKGSGRVLGLGLTISYFF